MIYVYYSYLSEENHESLLKDHLPKFSADFQQKIKKYRRWQDAQLSLMGRVLLFNGIEEIKKADLRDKEIKYTKFSKPYFEEDSVNFNISHSGEIVICAFCNEYEIGVDIEVITDMKINDFKFQMTESEWKRISLSKNKNNAFFDYWTQKEAVMKAYGQGLSMPLKSFEIFENTTNIKDEKFYLKEIEIDEYYKCYVSLNAHIDNVVLKKYNKN